MFVSRKAAHSEIILFFDNGWLIVEPEKVESARDLFRQTSINAGSRAFRSSTRLKILS